MQTEIFLDCLDWYKTLVGQVRGAPREEVRKFLKGEAGKIMEAVKSSKIPKEAYLDIPQVIVEKRDSGYSAGYNMEINKRLGRKLMGMKDTLEMMMGKENSYLRIVDEWSWAEGRQVDMVQYLCNQQAEFLESGNPLRLKKIIQEDVGKALKVDPTTVSRLVKNLTAILPDGSLFFVEELITGAKIDEIRAVYAIDEIQKAMNGSGKPKIPAEKMARIVGELGLKEPSRRAVGNYRKIIKKYGHEESGESRPVA